MAQHLTRLEVNMNDETNAAVRRFMQRDDVSATEVVRRAIGLYNYLKDKRVGVLDPYTGKVSVEVELL